LRVFSGRAEVRRDGGPAKITVKRGQAVDLGDGLNVARFNLKDLDGLQIWANARSSRMASPRGLGLRPQPPRIAVWRSDPTVLDRLGNLP
jgi:hypothetical protein